MANIAKKISFIIFSAVIVFFITGNSFANNDMLHKAAESTKNGVGIQKMLCKMHQMLFKILLIQ